MSLDHWLKVAQIVATIFLGGVALAVSIQQLRIAGVKQRLDLYDRRMAILVATREYTSKLLNSSDFSTDDAVDYQRSTMEARYLFGKAINKEFESLVKIGLEIDMQNIYLEELRTGGNAPGAPKSPARQKAILKSSAMSKSEKILEMSQKYLNLGK